MSNQIVAEPNHAISFSYKQALRLTKLGNAYGFTVTRLAEKAGLSTSTVYRFLNAGLRAYNPQSSTLVKLAGAFKMPLHDFVNQTKAANTRQAISATASK
jgi:transcriptional regulator with XRE-family HTH domain